MNKRVYIKCPTCGKRRQVALGHAKKAQLRECRSCAYKSNPLSKAPRGEQCHNWKGGRIIHEGYIEIKLQPEDFFYPMARSNGYVPEHRLVMAKHIGRNLHRWEDVHHINGNKQDNQINNLLLRDTNSHKKKYGVAYLEGYLAGYRDAKSHKKPQYVQPQQ